MSQFLYFLFCIVFSSSMAFAADLGLKTDSEATRSISDAQITHIDFKKSWILTKAQDFIFANPDGTPGQFQLPVNTLHLVQETSTGQLTLESYTLLLNYLQLDFPILASLESKINKMGLSSAEKEYIFDRLPAYINLESPNHDGFSGPSTVLYGTGYNFFGQLELDVRMPNLKSTPPVAPILTHYEIYAPSLNPYVMNVRNSDILREAQKSLYAKLQSPQTAFWSFTDSGVSRAATNLVTRYDRYFSLTSSFQRYLPASAILGANLTAQSSVLSLLNFTAHSEPFAASVSLGPATLVSARDSRSTHDRYFKAGWFHFWRYYGSYPESSSLAVDDIEYPNYLTVGASPALDLYVIHSATVDGTVSESDVNIQVPMRQSKATLADHFLAVSTDTPVEDSRDNSWINWLDDESRYADDDSTNSTGAQLRRDNRYISSNARISEMKAAAKAWKEKQLAKASASGSISTAHTSYVSEAETTTNDFAAGLDETYEHYLVELQNEIKDSAGTIDCTSLKSSLKRSLCIDLKALLSVTSPDADDSFVDFDFRQIKYDTLQKVFYFTLTNNHLYYISTNHASSIHEVQLSDFNDSNIQEFMILGLYEDGLVNVLETLTDGSTRQTLRHLNVATAQSLSKVYVNYDTLATSSAFEGYQIIQACLGKGDISTNSYSEAYAWGMALLRKYPNITTANRALAPDSTQTRIITFAGPASSMPVITTPSTLSAISSATLPTVSTAEIIDIDCGRNFGMAITANLDQLRSASPTSETATNVWFWGKNTLVDGGSTVSRFAPGYGLSYPAAGSFTVKRFRVSDFATVPEMHDEAGEPNTLIPLRLQLRSDSEQTGVLFGNLKVN